MLQVLVFLEDGEDTLLAANTCFGTKILTVIFYVPCLARSLTCRIRLREQLIASSLIVMVTVCKTVLNQYIAIMWQLISIYGAVFGRGGYSQKHIHKSKSVKHQARHTNAEQALGFLAYLCPIREKTVGISSFDVLAMKLCYSVFCYAKGRSGFLSLQAWLW